METGLVAVGLALLVGALLTLLFGNGMFSKKWNPEGKVRLSLTHTAATSTDRPYDVRPF